MSREITVEGTWEFFVKSDPHPWHAYEGDPEQLRASLAPKRLTVWLPNGKKVICRRSRLQICQRNHTTREFVHYYRDRFDDLKRIRFVIPDNVPLNEETKNV